ncbi:hypothetical protein PLICRDRAFT_397916 [Plicaturopsis crispa FD-325 SS-3]|nr:hypothetical protein PLICRDRAFT_397916 [Plicaturopsis crispa FD-325 SS-3]
MGDIVVINDDSEDDAGAVGAGEPEGSGSGNESFEANEGAKDDKSQVQQDQPRRSGRPRKPIQFDSNSDHEESEQRVVIPPPRRPIVKAKNPTTSRPQSGNAGNMNAHAASSSQSRVRKLHLIRANCSQISRRINFLSKPHPQPPPRVVHPPLHLIWTQPCRSFSKASV